MLMSKKSIFSNRGFTMVEVLVVIAIIGILSTLGIRSFTSSQIKSRDLRRKADLTSIAKTLEAYLNDYGSYPSNDETGKIMGCGSAAAAAACTWGSEFVDDNNTLYMLQLPADPKQGNVYFYQSTGSQYALFALLENTLDSDVMADPSANPFCGSTNCNYRITSSNYQ